MPKIVKTHTQYFDGSFKLHTLAPGDTVPKEHEQFVKNPAVFAEGPAPEPRSNEPVDLASLDKKALVALAKELGIASSGNVGELRERIAAKQAEPPAIDADTEAADLEQLDREQLEALAAERGITEFDENTSDAELVALLESED